MQETLTFTPIDEHTQQAVFAKLYGEPLADCPAELYIPPEALRIFLESFEGPLDFLLYLIRKQKFDVMDIPMAKLTDQYLRYVELIRESNLELAAAYLVMSATLMQIKSRLLLPAPPREGNDEPEDPRAELMRRLQEYEKIRDLGRQLSTLPREGRDFWLMNVEMSLPENPYPCVDAWELRTAWEGVLAQAKLLTHHTVTREELSIREHMTQILKRVSTQGTVRFSELITPKASKYQITVWFLALLELGKEGLIKITQAESFGEIYLAGSEADTTLTLVSP